MAKKKSEFEIADLKPDPENARRHPERNRELLERSLKEVGAARSIVIDEDGTVLAGNGVLEAAVQAGIEKVQVVEADGKTVIAVRRRGLTPEQKKRLALFDNRTAELADWDISVLAALVEQDKGTLEGLWYEEELKELLAGVSGDGKGDQRVEDHDPQIDKAEELRKKWGVKEGQLWKLGRHVVACLDSTTEANVKHVLAGDASFVWADPPYGISIVATNVSVGGGEAYDIPFGGVKKQRGNVGGGEGIKASPGLYPIQMRVKRLGSTDRAKPFGKRTVRGSDGAANMVDVGKYAAVIGDETIETAEKASHLFLSLYPKALQIWWGANYYAHALAPSSCWIVWDKENTGNFADAELAWCSDKSAVRIFRHM